MNHPVQDLIEATLQDALAPEHLEVINESHMHNVPPGSESHFKIVAAAERFERVSLVQRHRLVNGALKPAIEQGVHAMALHLFSPAEWHARGQAQDSPRCRGGE